MLFRKHKLDGTTSPVYDTYFHMGLSCLDFPFILSSEAKEVFANDFHDEVGEDAYISDELPTKAYDLVIEFGYKGELTTAYSTVKAFRDFLRGADGMGADLDIYSPSKGIGRQHCYLKSFADGDFSYNNMEEILTFKVTFRVTDPETDITLAFPYAAMIDGNGIIRWYDESVLSTGDEETLVGMSFMGLNHETNGIVGGMKMRVYSSGSIQVYTGQWSETEGEYELIYETWHLQSGDEILFSSGEQMLGPTETPVGLGTDNFILVRNV